MNQNHIHKLIDRFLAGTATPEEKEEMQQYFFRHGLQEETPEAGIEFHPGKAQSKKMYRNLIQLLQPGSAAKVYRMHNKWKLRIAAVLIPVILIGAGIYLLLKPASIIKAKQTIAEIRNNSESIRYLKLKDGSEIWLNKHATLKLDTSNFIQNRKLVLEGEAYFDVSHDPAHPFSVSTGQLNTLVLGTSFSINSNSTYTNVTVFTGKVSLQSTGTDSQLLSPGQSGEYDQKTGAIRTTTASAYAIAWKTREIYCKNEKLESIIHYLEDFYGTNIRISKRIAGKQFSGTLSLRGNVSSVLNRLLYVHQLQHRKNQDGSIIIF